MPLNFEWDDAKAKLNVAKHGVSFVEGSTVFGDRFALTIDDPAHSAIEDRFVTVGSSHAKNILVVVHTERGDSIRIISVRRANKKERKTYEEISS